MRWYTLIPLISDVRVRFLLGFVIMAIVLAGILTLVEFRLKRKKEKKVAKIADESAIDKMPKFLKQDKTLKEKLDFVDKAAKEYFKETYGTSLNSDYATLIDKFEKRRVRHKNIFSENRVSKEIPVLLSKNEVKFCKAMFTTYYSNMKLNDGKVNAIANLLISIGKNKKRNSEAPEIFSFVEKTDKIFVKIANIFIKKEIKIGEQNVGWIGKIVERGNRIIYGDKIGKRKAEDRVKKLLKLKNLELRRKKFLIIKRNKAIVRKHVAKRKLALRTERVRRNRINKQTLLLQKRARKELAEIKRQKTILWEVAKKDAIAKRQRIGARQKELDKRRKIIAKIIWRKQKFQDSVSKETIVEIEKGSYEPSKIKSSIKNIIVTFQKKRKAALKRKKIQAEQNHLRILTERRVIRREENLEIAKKAEIQAERKKERAIIIEEKKREKVIIGARRKRRRAKRIAKIKSSIEDINKFLKRKRNAALRRKKIQAEQNHLRILAKHRIIERKRNLKEVKEAEIRAEKEKEKVIVMAERRRKRAKRIVKIKSSIGVIKKFFKRKREVFLRKKIQAEQNHLKILAKRKDIKEKKNLEMARKAEIQAEKEKEKTEKAEIRAEKERERAIIIGERKKKKAIVRVEKKKARRIAKIKSSIKIAKNFFEKGKQTIAKLNKNLDVVKDVVVKARGKSETGFTKVKDSWASRKKQDKIVNTKFSVKNIDDFFNKGKYNSLERKQVETKRKDEIGFVKNRIFQANGGKTEQIVKIKSPIKDVNKFFKKTGQNIIKRLVVAGNKKTPSYRQDIVEVREEGIAERIVRKEKIRLNREDVCNVGF